MQLASCWELFAKDIASLLNWNPGMDSENALVFWASTATVRKARQAF